MKRLFVALVAFALSGALMAQDKLIIAGGGGIKKGSTYSQMIGDLASVCSTDQFPIEEQNTNGGVQNLEMLRGGKVEAALVPTSVLYAMRLDNPASVANIKTLVSLHGEEVHLIAYTGERKEGGFGLGKLKFNQKEVVYNSVDDLKGRPVGAVGGSVVDAGVLSDILRLGLQVIPFADNDALKAALVTGQIDAAVVVAGTPSAFVASLPQGQFKLLSIRGNGETSVAYFPTKVSYSNLGGRSVDTLATQALLVSRTFRSQQMLNNLGALRKCFQDNLANIQDKRGAHPKWQDVDASQQGKWEWYSLPGSVASVTTTPKKK
jgi:ABC-type amino acid transport substrate-binding protein